MNKQNLFYEHFFLGLLEGDGSIQVNHWKKTYLQFRIIIKLKETRENYQMCVMLRNKLGIMNLRIRKGSIILVEDHKQKLPKVMQLIEKNGLITEKRKTQYAFFKYCFSSQIQISEYLWIKQHFQKWVDWQFPDGQLLEFQASSIQELAYFPDWLCGFVEAEGSFCVRKNGTHSFSIAQKGEKQTILAIQAFWKIPNKVQKKSNDLYAIETSNRHTIRRVIEFFQKGCIDHRNRRLLGSKASQFDQFSQSYLSRLK